MSSPPAGNRAPVSRVTGGDTYHYTTEELWFVELNIEQFKRSVIPLLTQVWQLRINFSQLHEFSLLHIYFLYLHDRIPAKASYSMKGMAICNSLQAWIQNFSSVVSMLQTCSNLISLFFLFFCFYSRSMKIIFKLTVLQSENKCSA